MPLCALLTFSIAVAAATSLYQCRRFSVTVTQAKWEVLLLYFQNIMHIKACIMAKRGENETSGGGRGHMIGMTVIAFRYT